MHPRGTSTTASRAEGRLVRAVQNAFSRLRVPIFGLHNAANALPHARLAGAGKLRLASLAAGLRTFRGLPHRLQRVSVRPRRGLVDDWLTGNNVGATRSPRSRARPQGDTDRRRGQSRARHCLSLGAAVRARASRVLLIGRDAPQIELALATSGVPLERCGSLEQAVTRAAECARPGEAVLLSPACASFDMFRDYRQRGEAFCAAVRALGD